MRLVSISAIVFSLFAILRLPEIVNAQGKGETLLPAGTLVKCTLEEPNFSSKTAEVGDPVICNLNSVFLFGRSAFPRGAYLAGHLVADKEPGHIVGKGFIRLEFDRIGMPDGLVPLPAKVVGASKYNVDATGDILGKGHATRDAVEWMLPPLWPIKLLVLPARGPQIVLKGEQQLTLRIMDDVTIPVETQSNLNASNGTSMTSPQPADHAVRRPYTPPPRPAVAYAPRPAAPPVNVYVLPPPVYPPAAYWAIPRAPYYGRYHPRCGPYGCL